MGSGYREGVTPVGGGESRLGFGLQRDATEDLILGILLVTPLPFSLPSSWDPQGKLASTERYLSDPMCRPGCPPSLSRALGLGNQESRWATKCR